MWEEWWGNSVREERQRDREHENMQVTVMVRRTAKEHLILQLSLVGAKSPTVYRQGQVGIRVVCCE